MGLQIMLREFDSASELIAHYSVIRKRLKGPVLPPVKIIVAAPPPPPPEPEPVPPPQPQLKPKPLLPSKAKLIIGIVAKAYNLYRHDITGARRTADVVWPRQVSMYLIRTLTGMSFPRIGAAHGGRDHTTALHGCKAVIKKASISPIRAQEVTLLCFACVMALEDGHD